MNATDAAAPATAAPIPRRQGPVRIGGASGFWGDSSVGPIQLVTRGQVDFLVFDYLAELTMSILAGQRLKKPELGYATDFVSVAMASVLHEVVARGIRVVSNAGGVNPEGCAAALAALAAEQGVALRIAVVTGDDVMPQLDALREDLASVVDLPERVLSANAYLGALPIQVALDAGAQVVITGRCVDSAVTLGVLMHAFGWAADDFDRLAAGSLAGHILECGCQATGGLHTDWERVPDWPDIGYPVAECHADGRFVVTKPAGTGGLVTPAVVAEQMLYEIHDPARYLLPDVVCDFTQVRLRQDGPDRVEVVGARGLPPPATCKVSATHAQGFRVSAQLTIVGLQAVAKARRTGDAILSRTRRLLAERGLADYTETLIEVLGGESCYGPHARADTTREAVLRLSATHARREALELLAREIAPAGTSWAPGTTGASGRPAVSPSIRQFAFLLPKTLLHPRVHIDGRVIPVPWPVAASADVDMAMVGREGEAHGAAHAVVSMGRGEAMARVDRDEQREVVADAGNPEPGAEADAAGIQLQPPPQGLSGLSDTVEVPLIRLAWARSGDKGDTANIGVIARHPSLLPLLRAQLTEAAVAAWLAHLVHGRVTRHDVPGIHAFNFVCEQALGGGGMASLRNDPLGKGMAQILLSMPLRVPAGLMVRTSPDN
jgi:hypothetical protein